MRYTKNQKHLINSSALYALYYGLTGAFLVAFALALGASNTVIGFLSSLPFIAIIIAEFPGAKLVEFYSRKKVCIILLVLSRLLWIPIILIPVLFKHHPILSLVIYFFLVRFTEYAADPAWMSLAGDLVPVKVRGKFFAKRNMMIGLAMAITGVVGASYLDLFPKNSSFGFSSMFFVGMLFGVWSVLLLGRIKEPEYRDHRHHKLKEFFSLKGEFRKFVLIIVFFNFAAMLASPFFAVYMLKDLEMSYTLFMVAMGMGTVAKILSHTQYGKVSDRYGDKPVAIISMFGTAMVPLSYLFITKDVYWFVFPAQILSGAVWAGVDLSVFNLFLDLSDKKNRAVSTAKYLMISSIPMIIAPVVGGYIADNFTLVLTGIPLLFGIAFLLRASSSVLLFTIKEPRAKEEHSVKEVFQKLLAVHPIKGMRHAIKHLHKPKGL